MQIKISIQKTQKGNSQKNKPKLLEKELQHLSLRKEVLSPHCLSTAQTHHLQAAHHLFFLYFSSLTSKFNGNLKFSIFFCNFNYFNLVWLRAYLLHCHTITIRTLPFLPLHFQWLFGPNIWLFPVPHLPLTKSSPALCFISFLPQHITFKNETTHLIRIHITHTVCV